MCQKIFSPHLATGAEFFVCNSDQLMSYNGETFVYDQIGNPTTYDSNGNLIKQSNGLDFFYDHAGVFAVKYDGSAYFYRKDVLGNVYPYIFFVPTP